MRDGRRGFLRSSASGLAALLASGAPRSSPAAPRRTPLLKPPRLRPGQTVGIINPGGVEPSAGDAQAMSCVFQELGLRVKCAPDGQPLASARARAAEVNAMFADDSVSAVVPVRGGWGSAELLPYLDYELIRRHPKVLMGSSDAAALLLGINARTGLVTFHGPMGISAWVPFTVEHVKRVLFRPEPITIHTVGASPGEDNDTAFRTITPGRASGPLLGGNLTVVSSIVGSPYLAAGAGAILFLEEVRELTSEVARMLTQLELAGILNGVRGIVFGQCTRCQPPFANRTLTLDRVLTKHVAALGVPAWRGASIGHVAQQVTVPIGLPVEIDAALGTIRLLEAAVR